MKKYLLRLRVSRYTTVLLFFMLSAAMWGQEMNEKYSMTTQMFLNELKEQQAGAPRRAPRTDRPNLVRTHKPHRLIASPDTVAGRVFVSCFIHLKDVNDTSALTALGIEIEETFDDMDFITARVPVDQLEPLADIDNVTRIKVAQRMRPMTDKARSLTNVDDLLTQSADATALGITGKYDGTGVILGVIDNGIDFQHIAFKDKNGNSRIKRAYVYNGYNAQEYTSITSSSPTTDDDAEDHGTHTATTAGGSSVIVSGTNVTVTDDHANATYGGMAPGADLYLAGIYGLEDTYLSNALKKMITYADNQGKPIVVSNSWGSGWGPRDGTGEWANLVANYFGDSHPNRVILFAASNDAGHSKDNEGGGLFVTKSSASSSSPLGTIMRCASYTDTDAGYSYYGLFACAWSSKQLACKLYVLDSSTGEIKKTWTVTSSTSSFSGLSSYYSGSLQVSIDRENGKYSLTAYSQDGLETNSYTGSSYYKSKYTLAIEVYPRSGTADIDMWAGDFGYFTDHLTTSGHTWTDGTDDMSVSDEATIPNAISVGAYVSKDKVKNYQGNNYSYTSGTLGDIAYFSSYATAAMSSTGQAYPVISAPGAQLVAGVNHYHTKYVDNNSYYASDNKSLLVVNSSSNPYGVMEGTSMATPVAAGIVALWLQASLDENAAHKNLTVNDVKEIMAATAITDSYTTGANAAHFGYGKIDALAGIKYILGSSSSPAIRVSTSELKLKAIYTEGMSQTATVNVKGVNLEDDITVTNSDASGIYTIDRTVITKAEAETTDGFDMTITWTPQEIGETTATLTLSSTGTADVVITITGHATEIPTIQSYELMTDASKLVAGDQVLIAYVNGNDAYVLSTNQKTNNRGATTDVTLNSDGTLTPGEEAQVITLEQDGTNYLFNVGNGYLYAASSFNNHLKTKETADDNAKAAITITSDGEASIIFQGSYTRNILRFNSNNGSPLFSCYASTSTTGSQPQIYRLVAETPTDIEALNDERLTLNDGVVYDLTGRRVNSPFGRLRAGTQLPRGLYIINGKKVFVK